MSLNNLIPLKNQYYTPIETFITINCLGYAKSLSFSRNINSLCYPDS